MTSDENDNTGPEIELFDGWVNKNYGGNSRTKTITSEKYGRICKLIRGEDPNSNAKFRFWVRNKGFRLLRHDIITDEILDDPCGSLFVSLHAKESSTPMGERSIEKFLRTNLPAISFFRKVAIVEEFYGIIKCSHVDEKGVHAGQKKTYRLVSDTYAFLPREVITFYLLNCKTCKPRIQKYGPIPSKARLNHLGPRKNTSGKDMVPSYSEKDGHKEESDPTHRVVRPCPKRYRPTFIDTLGHERYTKICEPEYKPHVSEEPPILRILDGRLPPPRHDYNSQPSYAIHGIPKGLELQIPRNDEEKCGKNYYYYPPYVIANSVNRAPKDYELVQERAHEDIERLINIRRERMHALERDVSSSLPSHLNYSYVHSERNVPRYFYGCRMQPYKLPEKSDQPDGYRKYVFESRETSPRPYYEPYTYLSDNRRVEMEKVPDMTNIVGSHEENWSIIPKSTREVLHADKPATKAAANNFPLNELREIYALDYIKESRRLITHRKENEFYSVDQYHKLVCDTVNSSLASLCYLPGQKNESTSHSLKIPDQTKISKVLEESNLDKLHDGVADCRTLDDN